MPEEDKVKRLQNKLYTIAKSNPTRKFHSLRDKVYRRDILEQAWKDVEENYGAPGPDGESILEVKRQGVDEFLDKLQRELQEGNYRSGPLRRVYIEKPNGGQRPLGIPCVRDRVVQAAVKLIIEPIFEADFQPFSYGYRPGKGAQDAVSEIYKWLNFGLEQVVDADIEHCFDEIPHDRLMSVIANRVADGYILKLIKMWLKSPVVIDGTLCRVNKGTPQGGVISPLLANIYLNQLDSEWLKRGMTNRYGPDAHLVRYADDIVILTSRSAGHPKGVLCEILGNLGLRLSEKKTRTVHAQEGFDFLGFRFIRRYSKKYKKRKTYRFPSPRSIKRVKEKIRDRAGNHVLHIPPEEVAKSLNRLVIGWETYFRHSNASQAFKVVTEYVVLRFRRLLNRRKQKSGIGGYRDLPNEALAKRYGLIVTQAVTITYR